MALFLAFCRIGGCFMVLPGFSSARLPMEIRLFASLAVSMAVLPLLWDILYPRAAGDPATYVVLIVSEVLVGTMYGLIARFYVAGLQFAGSVLSMAIAFHGPGATDILEDVPENQLTNLLTFSGLLVLFMLDFHHIVLRAVLDSYTALPVGGLVDPQGMLITLTDTLSQTFSIMLRLASPFVLYGLMFNVAVGLIGKLAPQIPIYFISTPYALMGGIFLLYLAIASFIRQFADGFGPIFIGQ